MSVWNDCVQSYLSDFITSPKVQQEEKDHSNANICLHCCNIQAGQLSHIYKATEVKMCVCLCACVCQIFNFNCPYTNLLTFLFFGLI